MIGVSPKSAREHLAQPDQLLHDVHLITGVNRQLTKPDSVSGRTELLYPYVFKLYRFSSHSIEKVTRHECVHLHTKGSLNGLKNKLNEI